MRRGTDGRLVAACVVAVAAGALLFAAAASTGEAVRSPAAKASTAVSGEAVYARWCVHCHAAGRGNPGTESLQVKYRGALPAVLLERTDLTPEAVAAFVRRGALSMAPFRKTEISDEELAALAEYVANAANNRQIVPARQR
jgi:mono/diheme cytochrome c family protein